MLSWYFFGRTAARARRHAPAVHTRQTMRFATRVALWFHACLALLMFSGFMAVACAQGIPRDAQRHQPTLKREAQRVWGINAPIATFAAQVHQESRWRENARSPVGAQGLTQFMPATTNWIGGLYPSLADRAPYNPTWALRALVTYDKWLLDRIKAETPCDRMAFALAAYNGGLGWVYKRQKLSKEPGRCMGKTCAINPGVTAASQRENQHYPEIILLKYEPMYANWGAGSCS